MTTLAETIALGGYDSQLDKIERAVKARQRSIAHAKVYSLSVGDKVTISDEVRPKYLAGVQGTVSRINNRTVIVDFDHPVISPQGKRWGSNIKVPVELLK